MQHLRHRGLRPWFRDHEARACIPQEVRLCALVIHSTATPHCSGDHTRECVRDDCARHCSYVARVRGVWALEVPPHEHPGRPHGGR